MTDPAQGEPDASTDTEDASLPTLSTADDVAALAEELGVTVQELGKRLGESARWEKRARGNAKKAREYDQLASELESLRRQNESDLDRAVREAEERGRTAALTETGAERVADAFRVAAAGRDIDVDDLLDMIDVAKFLGDDGRPDRDAITARVQKLAPEREPAPLDLGQGARGGDTVPGLNSSQLERDLKTKLGIS